MQIQNSVRFEDSIARLLADGAERFIEIGPGNALAGFVKKTAKAHGKVVTVDTIDTAEQLDAVLETERERG